MNTIVLSSTEHLKALAIASAPLEDPVIFIVLKEGENTIPLRPMHIDMPVKSATHQLPIRRSADQPWKKPWKR